MFSFNELGKTEEEQIRGSSQGTGYRTEWESKVLLWTH